MGNNGEKHPFFTRDNRKATGAAGEKAAADFLEHEGYTILERNWRCRSGELDIVACKDGLVVIVEVRSRSAGSSSFGSPAESVNARKIRQVRDTAQVYLFQSGRSGLAVRFDVVAVLLDRKGEAVSTEHIMAAF
ncbi:YraN family protein [Paenibacillus caui]|uniref:YraN family protein n=1 Tax=Paenibacillus caui TaxID=2873927 RepID=UPI001CA9F94C